ncbi:ATP-binding protein [Owenweeksia hongkongensis]|uniref:ATP-binding protein n=1 Tax=Owenweeksia hongkongensis TaxID=253245 RepID=UPI003A9574DE
MKLTKDYTVLTLLVLIFSISIVYGQSLNDAMEDKEDAVMDSIINHFQQFAWKVNSTSPDLAQSYLDSASNFTNARTQTLALAKILEIKGALHLANLNYKEASMALRQSINLYNQSDKHKFRAGFAQIELGTIYYNLGQYEEAIKFYQPAIDLFESADKANKVYGKSLAHNNIGLCQLQFKDYSGALKSFNKGLEYRLTLPQPELIAHSHNYIAKVYRDLGHYAKADSVIDKGLALNGLDTNDLWYKQLELKKGHLKILQGNTHEAQVLLGKVNSYAYTNKQEELYEELNQSLSKLYISTNEFDQAKAYATRGYKEQLAGRNYKGAIAFANLNKEIALQQGNTEKALLYSEKVSALKDSFITQNSIALKDLMNLGGEIIEAQHENDELQNTKNEYSNVIEDQKDLLIASVTLIVLLLLIAYIVTQLNNKLKENQKNQRELNLRILAVINRSESLIISLGADGVIRVINKPAVNFFKNWINIELQAGDQMEEKLLGTKAFSSWKNALKKSKSVKHWKEVSQFNIKKQRYYFLENFSSISHKDGSYAGLVMVANDITKEHEFNIKMSEQNNSLEKSNKAKERMLSILAHDLKDAVYSAHSLSELVLETPDEFPKEELIHLFSLLHGNFDKTKSLLDGLLDWIRTQTGGLDINPTPFILSNLVSEVFEASYPKSISKKIALSMEIPSDLAVSGDREMIKTVLRNLVNNSLKYTQPESGCVKVISKQEGDMISISVKDNGQGISRENQKKLFQGPGKFTTVGTAKEQGTGFGLSLCKELINLHKTELSVNSEEGEGSEFQFQLPMAHTNDLSKKQLH